MALLASISPVDAALAIFLAIPLGLAAVTLLLVALVLALLAGCAAAMWALRRANEAVLGSAAEL